MEHNFLLRREEDRRGLLGKISEDLDLGYHPSLVQETTLFLPMEHMRFCLEVWREVSQDTPYIPCVLLHEFLFCKLHFDLLKQDSLQITSGLLL